jgi:hypothetical protein
VARGILIGISLLLQPFRKPLEPVGQGQQLISAAEIVSYLVGEASEL